MGEGFTEVTIMERGYQQLNTYFNHFMVGYLPVGLFLSFIFLSVWVLFHVSLNEEHGEFFRLIYIYVPTAFASLGLFLCMGILSIVHWAWEIEIADWVASITAKWGTVSTAIAIMSGFAWGYHIKGLRVTQDAWLIIESLLLFLYVAYIIADRAKQQYLISKKVSVVIGGLGIINMILVYFSAYWWFSLLQQEEILYLPLHMLSWEITWPLFYAVVLWALLSIWVISFGVYIRKQRG